MSTQSATKPAYAELVEALRQVRFRANGTPYRQSDDIKTIVEPLLERIATGTPATAENLARDIHSALLRKR